MRRCRYCGRRWRLEHESFEPYHWACKHIDNCIARMVSRTRFGLRWL